MKDIYSMTAQPKNPQDELDVLERDCGYRPTAFIGPGEWIGDGSQLPFTKGHNSQLPGCYSFCAVADDGSIKHLYIGKAQNLRSRMVGHKNSGMIQCCFDWCNDNDCWFMVAFWLTEWRSHLEQKLLYKLTPIFNSADMNDGINHKKLSGAEFRGYRLLNQEHADFAGVGI